MNFDTRSTHGAVAPASAAPGPVVWGLKLSIEPRSGITFTPARRLPGLSERCSRRATVNVSGSSRLRKSSKRARQRLPKRLRNSSRIIAFRSSPPFDTVNCVTSSTAIATLSDTSHSSGLTLRAAYSAGRIVGSLFTSSMRALMPAM